MNEKRKGCLSCFYESVDPNQNPCKSCQDNYLWTPKLVDLARTISFEKYLEMNWQLLKIDISSGRNHSADFESNMDMVKQFLRYHDCEVEK